MYIDIEYIFIYHGYIMQYIIFTYICQEMLNHVFTALLLLYNYHTNVAQVLTLIHAGLIIRISNYRQDMTSGRKRIKRDQVSFVFRWVLIQPAAWTNCGRLLQVFLLARPPGLVAAVLVDESLGCGCVISRFAGDASTETK